MPNRVTLGKTSHTWIKGVQGCKNGSHLNKRITWKNGLHLEKMGHPEKIEPQFEKRHSGTVGEKSHLKNYVTHGKWVTLAKKGQAWRKRTHLDKLVTIGKMSHIWKLGKKEKTLLKNHSWKNKAHLEKRVTL